MTSSSGEVVDSRKIPALIVETDGCDIPLIDKDEHIILRTHNQRSPNRSSGAEAVSQDWQNTKLLSLTNTDPQYELTVKSFASIGIGVSNGRKITVRKVDTTFDPDDEEFRHSTGVHFPQSAHASSADLSSYTGSIWWKTSSEKKAARMEFFLSFVGFSCGFANMWRFPWLCYKHGGGAFLFAYYVLMVLCTAPLLVLELSIGQFTRSGPIGCLGKLAPLSKGIGISAVIVSMFMSLHYSVIESFSIHYIYSGFSPPQPCYNATVCRNPTVFPRQSSLTDDAEAPLVLYGWLLFTWTSIFMFAWRAFRSNGRSYYFTATLPIIIIVTFMALSVTLEGAEIGVRKLFTIEWPRLLGYEVWVDALSQCLHAFGLTYGVVIIAGCRSRFTSEIVHSCGFLTVVSAFISLVSATIVFASAASLLEHHKGYSLDGPGLVFEVFVYAIDNLPLPQLGAVVFGFVVVCTGLNTQLVIIEVIILFCQSTLPNPVRRVLRYREILSLVLCILLFGVGCVFVSSGDWLSVLLIDKYVGTNAVFVLLLLEGTVCSWIYGKNRVSRNLREMTRKNASAMNRGCWLVMIPLCSVLGVIFSCIDYSGDFDIMSEKEGGYIFAGWMLVILVLLPVPAAAFWVFLNSEGTTMKEKLITSLKSPIEECVCCNRGFTCLRETPSNALSRSASAPQLNAAAEAAKRYFAHTVYYPHVTVTGTNVTLPLRSLVTGSNFFVQPVLSDSWQNGISKEV